MGGRAFVGAIWLGLALGTPSLAEAPRRVASVNLCTDQLALMLAEEGQVVSVSKLAVDPQLSIMVEEAARLKLNHGGAEELWLLQPDLVLAGTFTARASVEMMARLGVKVIELPPPMKLADIRGQLEVVGRALGQEARAAELADQVDRALAEPAPKGEPLGAVIYQPNGYTSGDAGIADQLLSLAGFRNLAAELQLRPDGVLPLEVLLMAKPDLIVIPRPYPGASQAEGMLDHPALRKGRFAPAVIYSDPRWNCGLPTVVEALAELRKAHAALSAQRKEVRP